MKLVFNKHNRRTKRKKFNSPHSSLSVFKKNNYLLLVLPLLVCVSWSSSLPFRQQVPQPDDHEYSKIIKKEISFSPYGQVSLSNKYGKIEVTPWNKNRVKVAATILVRAGAEYYAERIFERIKIQFSHRGDVFSIATDILPPKQEWWLWGGEVQDDYTINYKVYMPATAAIKINNRHGDIEVRGIHGKANLFVQHGNINIIDLGDEASIYIEDGHAFVGKVGILKADIRHARVRLEEARQLEIDSRFSRLRLESAEEVISNSRYDTYTLQKVGRFINEGRYDDIEIEFAEEIDVTSKLSDLFIEEVSKSLLLDIDSSNVQAAQIGEHFRHVDLSGKFTDFSIGTSDIRQYQLDAIANYAGIRYPHNLSVEYERDLGTKHEVKGCRGSKPAPRIIRARLNYGSLKLED